MFKELDIKNVTKYYKDFKAVDDISLVVNKGEFLTILGPSGSGKTTLLKMIAGFEKIASGFINLDNNNIALKKPYERNMGMVFQNYALFPHMTVEKNVAYPLERRKINKKEVKRRVKEILEIVNLIDQGEKYPSQLSGGQQQRVALARAIVFNPPLLLLDEPLGALDKQLRQRMQLEVKHIQEKLGITTISVTHDQEEALTMSDRICIMNNGRVEQIDTPKNVYKYPKNLFVAEFLGEINLFKGELVNVDDKYAKVKLTNNEIVTVSINNFDSEINKGQVFVAIRPENTRMINSDHSNYINKLNAIVKELIYVGEAIIIKLTSHSRKITVKLNAELADSLQVNDQVVLGWSPNESTLIMEENQNGKEQLEETLTETAN